MNTDKFKSIALNVKTYKRVREMSDKCFPMPISMAKTNDFLIGEAYKKWVDGGWEKFDFNPYPNIKK